MKYGVKEYWIVNPLLNAVQIYSLDKKGDYQQKDVVKAEEIVQSFILEGFEIDVAALFK